VRERLSTWSLQLQVLKRRDLCASQALSAVVTAAIDQFRRWVTMDDRSALDQAASIGLLVHAASLLSTQGNEEHMIEDTVGAFRWLARVEVVFEPDSTFKHPEDCNVKVRFVDTSNDIHPLCEPQGMSAALKRTGQGTAAAAAEKLTTEGKPDKVHSDSLFTETIVDIDSLSAAIEAGLPKRERVGEEGEKSKGKSNSETRKNESKSKDKEGEAVKPTGETGENTTEPGGSLMSKALKRSGAQEHATATVNMSSNASGSAGSSGGRGSKLSRFDEDSAQIRVTISWPQESFVRLVDKERAQVALQIKPVLFTLGVNEMQTVANARGSVKLQNSTNKVAWQALDQYHQHLSEHWSKSTVRDARNRAATMASIAQLMTKLRDALDKQTADGGKVGWGSHRIIRAPEHIPTRAHARTHTPHPPTSEERGAAAAQRLGCEADEWSLQHIVQERKRPHEYVSDVGARYVDDPAGSWR
jgi:hypothetical protein